MPVRQHDSHTNLVLAAEPQRRVSRRRFLGRALLGAAAPVSLGWYMTQIEPFWLDVHEFEIAIPGLPAAFDGFRIAHLTDLHAGNGVKMDYLTRVVRQMDQMNCDCIAVTGDLVNHTASTIEPVAELLGTVKAPVFVSFGNHDYCPGSARPGKWTILADPLERALEANGCAVMRNAAATLKRGDERIWLVGLEDLYTDRFSPPMAFRGVDAKQVVIALSHNPDSSVWLENYGTNLILSGHTHGGQVRLPFLGAPALPLLNRRYEQGLFQLKNQCQMYVSRGVGFLWKARLCCRPELPCLILRRAAG